MLPHTGLFLLGKVALQMRIRRPFHIDIDIYRIFWRNSELKDSLTVRFDLTWCCPSLFPP